MSPPDNILTNFASHADPHTSVHEGFDCLYHIRVADHIHIKTFKPRFSVRIAQPCNRSSTVCYIISFPDCNGDGVKIFHKPNWCSHVHHCNWLHRITWVWNLLAQSTAHLQQYFQKILINEWIFFSGVRVSFLYLLFPFDGSMVSIYIMGTFTESIRVEKRQSSILNKPVTLKLYLGFRSMQRSWKGYWWCYHVCWQSEQLPAGNVPCLSHPGVYKTHDLRIVILILLHPAPFIRVKVSKRCTTIEKCLKAIAIALKWNKLNLSYVPAMLVSVLEHNNILEVQFPDLWVPKTVHIIIF